MAASADAPTAPPRHLVDPVADLLRESNEYVAAGERALADGHLVEARRFFDRALDVLLEWPGGVQADPRLDAQFARLVDRVSGYEFAALASGDGFTERPSEPAPIDELLADSVFDSLEPAPELESTIKADLWRTSHDVPIPLNEKVLSYVQLFQGRLREWFSEGLSRGTRLLPMIQSVFQSEGVPLDLAFIPLIESAFKPTALSRARARGVWQFMRGTAAEHGLRQTWYVDERADPEKSTRAAAKYLGTLRDMFDGDWHLALASYNSGPGRVQRAQRRSGLSDFWRLAGTRHLPRETREYVPMILAAIIIARNPGLYGFEITPLEPLAYDTVPVPQAVDLRKIAEWSGASLQQIQELNPELRRLITPVRQDGYEVKVPVGTSGALQARLAEAAPSELVSFQHHVVRRGESLSTIARRYGLPWTDLADANQLTKRSILRIGQELLIPHAPSALLASGRALPVETAEGGDRERASITYRVRRGDTLSHIARRFAVTVAQIKSWNRLRSDRIRAGIRLTLRVSQALAAQ